MLRPIPAWPDKNWPGRTVQRPAPHSSPSPDNAPSDSPTDLDHAKGIPGDRVRLLFRLNDRSAQAACPVPCGSPATQYPGQRPPVGGPSLAYALSPSGSSPCRHASMTTESCTAASVNTVNPSLRITANVRFHAKIPGVPLLRLFHLRVPFPVPILRRTRRIDDAGIHNRPFMPTNNPLSDR